MLRRSFLVGSLMVILIITGCATPYNPFKVSQEQFFAKTKVIALVPIIVPSDLQDPEPVKIKFESMIGDKLRDAGFLTIPSQEYSEIYKRMTDQMGSPHELTCRELCAKFKVDAFLYPSIDVVAAEWADGMASWWGTSESVEPITKAFLKGLLIRTSGTVPALVLSVTIRDINGAALYIDGGGIQVLAKISGIKKFVPVPRDMLFVDEGRNSKAVNLALEHLIKKPISPK